MERGPGHLLEDALELAAGGSDGAGDVVDGQGLGEAPLHLRLRVAEDLRSSRIGFRTSFVTVLGHTT